MTKHDYQKALTEIQASDGLTFSDTRESDSFYAQILMGNKESIINALKLAAIVTGECSDDMCEAAILVPVHADIGAWNKEIFKAMIAEAQRQAEGV